MTDTYADGFLDGWACAAETLRTRFHLTARDASTGARIDGERSAGLGAGPRPPEGKPWLVGPQEQILRTVREQVANTHPVDLRVDLDCASCTLHLMVAGACMHCGWEMP